MISIREAFGKSLLEIGDKDDKVVLVSCDLKVATKSDYFYQKFTDRSFEVGIAEANAIGIAAGLGMSGFKTVLSSFGAFLSGKNVEIRTSIAYNNAPVVLVGTHGGLIGPDGATQSGIQDISVMRSIPRMKVFQPSTPILTEKILKHCINLSSPSYIRVARNEVPELYKEDQEFIEGEPLVHGEDSDYLIISSGPMLHNCLDAAIYLREEHKVNLRIIDIPTIKPLNKNRLNKICKEKKYIFTIEDHMVAGGIGSLILETLGPTNSSAKIFVKGLDSFVGSGKPDDLEIRYFLDKMSIVNFILDIIS